MYLSPEVITGASDASYDHSKRDIYAIGIILFEMWCAFGTLMERITSIDALKRRNLFPPGFEDLQAKARRPGHLPFLSNADLDRVQTDLERVNSDLERVNSDLDSVQTLTSNAFKLLTLRPRIRCHTANSLPISGCLGAAQSRATTRCFSAICAMEVVNVRVCVVGAQACAS